MRWIALSQYSIPCYLLCLLYLVPSLHGLITCLLPPWAHTSLFGQHLAWDSPHWVWVGSRIIEWVKQENRSLCTRYSLFSSLSLKSWYEVVILLILWPSEREPCRGLLISWLRLSLVQYSSSQFCSVYRQTEVYGQLWDNYWGGFLRHLDVKVHRRQIISNSHEIKLFQPTLKDVYICPLVDHVTYYYYGYSVLVTVIL